MEETNNKNMWMWVVVVVVVVAGLLVWSMNKSPVLAPGGDINPIVDTGENTALDVNTGTEDRSEGSVNIGSLAVSLSYEQALVKYKDARIQLDKTCQASPDNGTFKNGTNIMIDNRAPVARTVKLGSVFLIKAYSFKIVKLSSAILPTTWYLDCDKSQNVATVLIQK